MTHKTEPQYIGREEAYEICCIEWGNNKLPRKGKEWLRVGMRNEPVPLIGKDDNGYYYSEYLSEGV